MSQINEQARAEFLRGFITTALWSTTDDRDEEGRNLDSDYDRDDLTHHARTEMAELCKDFIDANEADLLLYFAAREHVRHQGQGSAWTHAGHDFWLTAGHHGVGFWDRGLEDLGDRLTEAARTFDMPHLFVDEDDRIEAS